MTAIDALRIRAAGDTDREAVATFVTMEHRRGGHVGDLGVIDMLIAEGRVWLALSRGRIVGIVAAGEIEGALHIEALHVKPERRGQGIRLALVAAVVDFGRWAFFSAVTALVDEPVDERCLRAGGFLPLDAERLPDDLARAARGRVRGEMRRAFARRL